MKHIMKSLKHNGIYVPPYDPKGFNVKIAGQAFKLTEKTEPMAVAWARRILSTTITPPDKVFTKNFMKEFLAKLREENPKATFLDAFTKKYLDAIENAPATLNNGSQPLEQEIDFSQVTSYVEADKAAKLALSKEDHEKANTKSGGRNVTAEVSARSARE
jgi:hypothetical protein